jgi:predicted metalloprotease with PDZ domain
MNQPQQPEAIYTVGLDPERPRHLLVEVQWHVQGAETRFRLPQWRPGRYEQSLFVRNLVALTAQNENGEPLPVIKTEASEWLVHHPGSTTLRLSYRYFANQPDAGACWADPE